MVASGVRRDGQPSRYGDRVVAFAAHASQERLLRCIEAVLACREALAVNVKPKFAVDAMVATGSGAPVRGVDSPLGWRDALRASAHRRPGRLSSVGRAIHS